MKAQVDYSLYLVTDSTEAILGNRDLIAVVEQALEGGKLCFFTRTCSNSHDSALLHYSAD
jgi:thiamine-phosphate diphosphorylase/hydroxyethylthiazole kinase